jgi:hypothetical protein
MRRGSATILVVTLAFMAAASAQMQMAKPGPEQRKLEYFVGTWSMDGDTKPSPMGPGGKITGTDHIEWMDGGFFLVAHGENKSPMGSDTGLAVWGYNAQDKVYTYHEFNSSGESVSATGTVDGDTWTWTSDDKMNGKMMKGRYTIKQLSPASYTFKFEMQPEGAQWATIMEGKATKTK